jgi:hypothetical protein
VVYLCVVKQRHQVSRFLDELVGGDLQPRALRADLQAVIHDFVAQLLELCAAHRGIIVCHLPASDRFGTHRQYGTSPLRDAI